jgi:hypothetical protein
MIVIPMAGRSKRFYDKGYTLPKYMLPLGNGTVFDRAVNSFRRYFQTIEFLFICIDVNGTEEFVRRSCDVMGIRNKTIVMLDSPTSGQAETVQFGLNRAKVPDNASITIFNIDTFRPEFTFPDDEWWSLTDGYLEVFEGEGSNWSYVLGSDTEPNLVLRTAEKQRISTLCCTGLYHFRSAGDFRFALKEEERTPSANERYVAPLYNHLISRGKHIHFRLIPDSQILFCGVPSEYEALLSGGLLST